MRRIFAHLTEDCAGMCAEINSGKVDFRQSLDVAEDGFELVLEGGDFLGTEFKAGEIGDVTDVDVAVRYGLEPQEMVRVFQVPSVAD